MIYNDLPKIEFDVIRGETHTIKFGTITVNEIELNLVEAEPWLFIKSAVDVSRKPIVELTLDNGLSVDENNCLLANIEEYTSDMQASKYYSDLSLLLNGVRRVLFRIEFNMSGAISVEGKENGCNN